MNSFGARTTLKISGKQYEIYALDALSDEFDLHRLPYCLKVLLENLLRHEDGANVTKEDIVALANWDPIAEPSEEISFTPARVLMQDFTGVPAVVDLATMRDAMRDLGSEPYKINPLSPADLVIDQSLRVDHYGSKDALDLNAALEYKRNLERYQFLRWGQKAFSNFRVVPPETGIVHQVNLEYLAQVVFHKAVNGNHQVYPDTLVGTDSHTTMINGLGVLGWGVGGIEAEAAMLGQPIPMLIPQVVGFELTGGLPEGATATDLVLTVVQMLREKGVVGKFVEFFGDGLDGLSLADQATIANMAPEYGATCGIFPIDQAALDYLRLTGRSEAQIELVEAYAKRQGMYRQTGGRAVDDSEGLQLDMADVEPSRAGPAKWLFFQDLRPAKAIVNEHMKEMQPEPAPAQHVSLHGEDFELEDGDVVIAAITSCTNTSNPDVIMGAGLLAKNAWERGIKVKPWVKTSLAPGSKVVTEYLRKAGLMPALEALGFDIVGYGCTTCIGNSGPLPEQISKAINEANLVACSVLSGNRNFEGRIHADVRMNFLASPPLVVAYAIAGTTKIDLFNEPIAQDKAGNDVYLKDIWPSQKEINNVVNKTISREMFQSKYADILTGDSRWQRIETPEGALFDWDADSTYVRKPPFFDGMPRTPDDIAPIEGARLLAKLGDSITTDHISPAGAIKPDSPAGQYLIEHGVSPAEFNSYGSRRGNHEVMMRGTFANIRLRNELAPGTEGGWTHYQPGGEQMTIYDAAMRYQEVGVPLMVIAGKEYGTGSSRDWAAKGTRLLGVRAVVAESFERIHRSNLIGMGVLPLQFKPSDNRNTLGLSGEEEYAVEQLQVGASKVTVVADGKSFDVHVRIDTPKEWEYYVPGGILPYVIRQLVAGTQKAA